MFLQTATINPESLLPFAGAFAAFAIIMTIVLIALYVYAAIAWMTIGRKLGYKNSWIAFIPIANYFLFAILAKKHWTWGFMFFVPLANFVFAIIWHWNIFERRKYPGALSLIMIGWIIPFINWLATLAYLVVIGLVAWQDKK